MRSGPWEVRVGERTLTVPRGQQRVVLTAGVRPRQLPHDLRTVVGREAELATLDDMLAGTPPHVPTVIAFGDHRSEARVRLDSDASSPRPAIRGSAAG